jgi:eukaryotic-like serine/threonine-protein kinase
MELPKEENLPDRVCGLEPGFLAGGGRYTLRRVLGSRAASVVWLAVENQLGEEVALKLFPAADCSSIFVSEIRRAVQANRRLSHPNIVRIFDFVEIPGEPLVIAMEYVQGVSFESLRRNDSTPVFTWEQMHPLLEQACAALEYAHSEGIVHGNLIPSNLLLDHRGRLKLADFALPSRCLYSESEPESAVYLSPQLLDGNTPSPADDLYALGVILYEMLSGHRPFLQGDLSHQIRERVPQPLAERLAESGLADQIPGSVSILVSACLAKNPAQRPRSAAAIAEWIAPKRAPAESLASPEPEIMSLIPPEPPAHLPAHPNALAEARAFEESLPANTNSTETGYHRQKVAVLVGAVLLLALGFLWGSSRNSPEPIASESLLTNPPPSAAAPEPSTEPPLATPQVASGPVVKVVNEIWSTPDRSQGLDALLHKDGKFTVVEQYGHRFWLIARKSHLYLGVDDTIRAGLGRHVEIELEYRNTDAGDIRLHYDSTDLSWPDQGAYKEYPTFVNRMNTGQWRTAKFQIADARFENRQNAGADLRFYNNGRPLLVQSVKMRRLPE